MSIQQEYRMIFEREILQKVKASFFLTLLYKIPIDTFHTLTQYRPPP